MALCWGLCLEITQGTQSIFSSRADVSVTFSMSCSSLCFHFSVVKPARCCAYYQSCLEHKCIKDEAGESSEDY